MVEVKPDSEETCRLLQQVELGDREAFDGLLSRHRDWLRRLVEMRRDSRLRGRIDPSDVVQETQLETYRRLGIFGAATNAVSPLASQDLAAAAADD